MIKKYKAKVNTSLYRDCDGCVGPKHERNLKMKNKYQEALDFLKEQLKLKYKVKEIHIAEIVAESFGDLQELIDNYSKLEKSLNYLLNYLDKKYLLDEEKSFSRYLYKELLEEDIRRMLESEKQ